MRASRPTVKNERFRRTGYCVLAVPDHVENRNRAVVSGSLHDDPVPAQRDGRCEVHASDDYFR